MSNGASRALVCALFAVLLPGCGDDPPPPLIANGPVPQGVLPATPQPVRAATLLAEATLPGITVHLLGPDYAPQILALELMPQRFSPVLVAEPQRGISAAAAMAEHDLTVSVGSGFVSEPGSLQPVGLLQRNGEILSPLERHGYTRILAFNDQGLAVLHRGNYTPQDYSGALQAGPGIIESGSVDISEQDLKRPRFYRSFVALCGDSWLAAVSLEPMNLRTLGLVLQEGLARQNKRCEEVVNLAGDRQAVLMVRLADGRLAYYGDPNSAKVSLMGFRAIPDPAAQHPARPDPEAPEGQTPEGDAQQTTGDTP